jgi:hypothetical protein
MRASPARPAASRYASWIRRRSSRGGLVAAGDRAEGRVDEKEAPAAEPVLGPAALEDVG